MPLCTQVSYSRLRHSFEDLATSFWPSYVGLCTGAPGDSTTLTANELSTGTYATRRALGGSGDWAEYVLSNGNMQQHIGTTAAWTPTGVDTITHFVFGQGNTPGSGHICWLELTNPVTTIASVPIYFRSSLGLQTQIITEFFTGGAAASTAEMFLPYIRGVQMWPTVTTDKYLGLSETIPTFEGGNITELSGSGYAREGIDGNDWAVGLGDGPTYGLLGSVARNNRAFVFPAATADWNTVSGYFISSVASGGTAANIYAAGALDSPITVRSGEVSSFLSSELLVAVY